MNQIDYITAGFIQFHENHPFPGRMIEMETSVEVLCIRIMTHPQVLGRKFTPIRRFLGRDLHPSAGFWTSETHPFWLHIPNMTQNGSAPPGREMGKDGDQGESSKSQRTTRVSSPSAEASLPRSLYPEMCMICKKKNLKLKHN